jgi:chromosome segregation ATPase
MTTATISAVEAAQNKLESIRQALIAGDTKLKPKDLLESKNELEFAELQAEAAKIVEQKNAEAERKARLLELQKQLAAVNDSRSVVDKKFTAFEKSLADYLSSCSDYQNELNGIRSELQNAGMYPGETIGIRAGFEPEDVVPGIKITDVRRVLSIGAVSAENVLPGEKIKTLVEASLGEYNRHF